MAFIPPCKGRELQLHKIYWNEDISSSEVYPIVVLIKL